jgi:tRNA (guanine-N7-)-methyltransferase
MSPAKHAAIAELGPSWMLDPATLLDAGARARALRRSAELLLDIGGGTGEATRAWAAANPDCDVVALELHRPGIARLLADLDRAGPPNVRVVEADATAVLPLLADAGLEAVRALFPDPWPKRRHVGRRLVDPTFVRAAVDALAPGGLLHLATDWASYADHMRSALSTDRRLDAEVLVETPSGGGATVRTVPIADVATVVGPGDDPGQPPPWRSPRSDRPVTAYEQRGLDAGRTIVDLVLCRAR